MAEYYLISQLPSLDGINENMPLPISEERVLELCSRFLGKKATAELQNLTLVPSRSYEGSTSELIEAWNEGERNLRLALGLLRAEKLKKQFSFEGMDGKVFSPELTLAVKTAVEIGSPMEAERFLDRYRLSFLESLRPMDAFSESYVFYYILKLKLLSRIRQFDKTSGEAAYKNIYNSIMNGDRLEEKQ